MHNLKLLIIQCLLVLVPGFQQSAHAAAEENPLTAQAKIIPFEVEKDQIAQVEIQLNLPKNYRAYEDQFKLSIASPEGLKVNQPNIQPVVEIFDKFTKKNKKVLVETGKLQAAISFENMHSLGEQKITFNLAYQACTDTYCLFPKTIQVDAFVNLKASVESESSMSLSFAGAYKKGLFWAFLFVFVFGFLTSFTPCIYPMIPITLAILGKEAHARTRMQNFFVSFVYVTGIGITFSGLGVFAASTGVLFGSFMSSPWVLGFMILVFTTMAASMFGLFEIEPPEFLRNGILSHLKLRGYAGALISGMLAGVVASPCVGPVLVGILTFVAQTKNLWLGFWLLFFYAFGMGLIFLALGLSTNATKLLPKSGPWMMRVKILFGSLLLIAAAYYLDILLVSTKTIQQSFISSATSVFAAKPENKTQFGIDAIVWQKYSPTILQQAIAEKKPVVIDFRADWCAACLELEEKTFTSQGVQLLASNFIMVKFDATNESPELDEMKKKYNIIGLPTVVFIDRKGNWLEDSTLTEFEDAAKFSERMNKAFKN